jgi:hypothetical protein
MVPLLLLIGAGWAGIDVLSKDMAAVGDNGSWRKVGLLARNSGPDSVSLDSASLRYTVRERRDSLAVSVWYFQVHDTTWRYNVQGTDKVAASVAKVDDSTRQILLTFQKGLKLPASGVLEIQFGAHRPDYSTMDQTRDPSHLATATYALNPNVAFSTGRSTSYASWTDTTILGQDRDGNGIRDDLDSILLANFPGNPVLRKTLSKAIVLQDSQLVLATSDNTAALVALSNRQMAANFCFLEQANAQGMDSDHVREAMEDLFANQINTYPRLQAYALVEQKVGSQYYTLPSEDETPTYCAEYWR